MDTFFYLRVTRPRGTVVYIHRGGGRGRGGHTLRPATHTGHKGAPTYSTVAYMYLDLASAR